MSAPPERVAALIRDVFALALRVPHRRRQRELRRRGHDLLQQARGERREGRLEALAARAGRYLRETEARWGDRLGAKPRAVLEAEAAARAAQGGAPPGPQGAAAHAPGTAARPAAEKTATGGGDAHSLRPEAAQSERGASGAGAAPG